MQSSRTAYLEISHRAVATVVHEAFTIAPKLVSWRLGWWSALPLSWTAHQHGRWGLRGTARRWMAAQEWADAAVV